MSYQYKGNTLYQSTIHKSKSSISIGVPVGKTKIQVTEKDWAIFQECNHADYVKYNNQTNELTKMLNDAQKREALILDMLRYKEEMSKPFNERPKHNWTNNK